jgi:hypothetical protein
MKGVMHVCGWLIHFQRAGVRSASALPLPTGPIAHRPSGVPGGFFRIMLREVHFVSTTNPYGMGPGLCGQRVSKIGCFLLAGVLENQGVDDEEVHQNMGCSFAALSGTD